MFDPTPLRNHLLVEVKISVDLSRDKDTVYTWLGVGWRNPGGEIARMKRTRGSGSRSSFAPLKARVQGLGLDLFPARPFEFLASGLLIQDRVMDEFLKLWEIGGVVSFRPIAILDLRISSHQLWVSQELNTRAAFVLSW